MNRQKASEDMSKSILTINGRDLPLDAKIAHAVYRLLHEIVVSGDTQTINLDVEFDGQPGKFVVLVNPSTQVTLFTNDVAAMSLPFYDVNVQPMLEAYLEKHADEDE